MAENSAKVANMARNLAIVHIIVGFLLICFGIADRAVEYFWTGYGGYGIWMGIWVSCAFFQVYVACAIFNSKRLSISLSWQKSGLPLWQGLSHWNFQYWHG